MHGTGLPVCVCSDTVSPHKPCLTFIPAGVCPAGQVLCVLVARCGSSSAPRCPDGAPLCPHPPREPFVLARLQPEDGLYLIHWSTSHLHRLILTVAQRDQVGLGRGSWAGAGRAPCLDPCSPPSPLLPPAPGTWREGLAPTEVPHRVAGWDCRAGGLGPVLPQRARAAGCPAGLLPAGRQRLLFPAPLLPATARRYQDGGATGLGLVGGPLPSVPTFRDCFHPQRSPTSSSRGDLGPAAGHSTSAISASTRSTRKTSPRCVARGWPLRARGTREAAWSRCHGDLPHHVPPAVPLGPGHEDQCV